MIIKTKIAFIAALLLLSGAAAAEGDPEAGAAIGYSCLGCHGIEGYRNAYPSYRVPKLGGQKAGYIEVALRGFRDAAYLAEELGYVDELPRLVFARDLGRLDEKALRARGLRITLASLWTPGSGGLAGAVVGVNNGCTGSFEASPHSLSKASRAPVIFKAPARTAWPS